MGKILEIPCSSHIYSKNEIGEISFSETPKEEIPQEGFIIAWIRGDSNFSFKCDCGELLNAAHVHCHKTNILCKACGESYCIKTRIIVERLNEIQQARATGEEVKQVLDKD